MKKFLKFVTGVAAVAGAACGVVYCLKKFCGIDLLNRDEDFDEFDEEFDDDFDDDDYYDDDFDDDYDDEGISDDTRNVDEFDDYFDDDDFDSFDDYNIKKEKRKKGDTFEMDFIDLD